MTLANSNMKDIFLMLFIALFSEMRLIRMNPRARIPSPDRVGIISRQRFRRVALAFVGILAMASSVTRCSQKSPIGTPTTVEKTDQVQTVSFTLLTHCGINELMANGKYFQRVGGYLDDNSHNPPAGWGNPSQSGTLTISSDIAVFRDKVGRMETFKVRSGATKFLEP